MEFKVESGESEVSQVSERARLSIFLSEMKSRRAAGLLSSTVMEETDPVLRWARLMEGKEATGPGLTWMSPESKRRIEQNRYEWRRGFKPDKVIEWCERKETGSQSREKQTEEFGNGW